MSNRLWVFGAVLASIAIVVLGWFLGISPKLAEADLASLDRQSVDSQNLAQEAAIALLKDQFANLDNIQADLEEVQVAVPPDSEVDKFFDEVTKQSAANGLVIEDLSVLEGAVYGGSVDPTAAADSEAVQPAEPVATDPNAPSATLDASLSGRFFTIGVSIKVSGSADQAFALTKALQAANRLFLVTDVDFTVEGGQPVATLTGFIYVVRDAAETPATTEAAP